MKADLVERLRNLSSPMEMGEVKDALAEAAARIEQLEHTLRQIAEHEVPLMNVDNYARRALLDKS